MDEIKILFIFFKQNPKFTYSNAEMNLRIDVVLLRIMMVHVVVDVMTKITKKKKNSNSRY